MNIREQMVQDNNANDGRDFGEANFGQMGNLLRFRGNRGDNLQG